MKPTLANIAFYLQPHSATRRWPSHVDSRQVKFTATSPPIIESLPQGWAHNQLQPHTHRENTVHLQQHYHQLDYKQYSNFRCSTHFWHHLYQINVKSILTELKCCSLGSLLIIQWKLKIPETENLTWVKTEVSYEYPILTENTCLITDKVALKVT